MRPLVIAHRGASGSAPENTLSAFESAVSMGADLIEVDVRSTADGHLVLLHDSGVERTTDGRGEIHRLPLDRIRQLDAGSWFGPEFAGERIPTLEEAIERISGRSLLLIEVKAQEIEGRLVDLLRRMGALAEVVCQAFSPEVVARLRQSEPRLAYGLLLGSIPEPMYPPKPSGSTASGSIEPGHAVAEAVLRHGAQIAALSGRIVTPDLVRSLKRRGIPTWVWTLNDPDHLRQAEAMGVDGIITDHPERLIRT